MISRNAVITLVAIIFVLLVIYIIMKGRNSAIKKRMDENSRFRRHR